MNIQQDASGLRLRPSPALREDCACPACAQLYRHKYAPPPPPLAVGNWKAVMASSAASSVRPPRPKKEPQALVIPKNAAEEQKLKLERLMKNPVRRSTGSTPPPSPLPLRRCWRPTGPPLPPPDLGTEYPNPRASP